MGGAPADRDERTLRPDHGAEPDADQRRRDNPRERDPGGWGAGMKPEDRDLAATTRQVAHDERDRDAGGRQWQHRPPDRLSGEADRRWQVAVGPVLKQEI